MTEITHQTVINPRPGVEAGAITIRLCDPHDLELQRELRLRQLEFATDGAELERKFKSNEKDPWLVGFDVITSIALRTMGSKFVCEHKCPICAFKAFDWIPQVADIVASTMKPKS